MIFNQPVFVGFLILVFFLYWLPLSRHGAHKHPVLLLASYVFYGWWDWRYLGLILFCSLVAYASALAMREPASQRIRKTSLIVAVAALLAVLLTFKYYDFFAASLVAAFHPIGITLHLSTLNVLLPVGISFYTFQAIGYTTSVYRREVKACEKPITFLTFQAFFPQLVAGPIERASSMLPQLEARRPFSYANAVLGCRLMLLGAFKKMVVADRIAPLADTIFGHQEIFSGSFNVLGAVLFSLQVYCDFSGYSDIARGVAKLFNLDLMVNFNRPYMAKSLREFWSRWHISLNTWLRDHIYIPLGGHHGTWARRSCNLMITFMLSGLWHGANWTFVCWGTMHGVFLIAERLARGGLDRLPMAMRWGITMSVILLGRVFFRAEDIGHAWEYLGRTVEAGESLLFQFDRLLRTFELSRVGFAATVLLTLLMMVIDRALGNASARRWIEEHHMARRLGYAAMVGIILLFGVYSDQRAFIYFQF